MSMMSNKLSSSVHHRNLLFVDIIINVLVLGRIEEKNHSSKKYTPSLFACFFVLMNERLGPTLQQSHHNQHRQQK